MVSLEDLLAEKIKSQLNEKRQEEYRPAVYNLPDESEIEDALKSQTEQLKTQLGDDDTDGLLDGLVDIFEMDQPTSKEEDDTRVKVTYERTGGVGYVDLTFSELDQELLQEEYDQIKEQLKVISASENEYTALTATKEIERFGEKAIEVLFRQIRLFDFKNKQEKYKLTALVQLGTRLTILSLKGRILLKAILLYAKNKQHIELAIRIAGQINEKEVIPEILGHAKDPDVFNAAFEAVLNMKDTAAAKDLLKIIDALETSRKDIIEEAIQLARNFNQLEPQIIKDVFYAYLRCTNRTVRPIFSVALKSFKDEVVPVLYEIIEFEYDSHMVREACKMLGGIRKPIASQKLKEALEKFPAKRASIIEGIGHTQDPSLAPSVVYELKRATSRHIKQNCLKALGSLGGKEFVPVVKPYLEDKEIHTEAIFCLVRLGDSTGFQQYLHLLINGTQEEQQNLGSYAGLLSFKDLINLARKIVEIPDAQAILLLSALQRPNVLPREIGPLLKDKLNQKPSVPVRLEIYRLIGKFVNTRNELLPQQVLYNARTNEPDVIVKREIDAIINKIQKKGGAFGFKLVGGEN
ncbi:HEAT repeat domain-containing protein [Neobacillus sp. NPDC093127]|uniref:HEAT repeat domain-containing protein n=1 Tax=Neobacillus sp. NPDC093127 TaxID=3364296 RepID=UPI00380DF5BA